ncbi:MAG: hypothetical protein IPH46_09125 [Bacteroidetes bacterium]|nr:hypothetical protein [Bacteroidota bacterium]
MAFKLSPHVICLATLVGGISGVFIAAFLGDELKRSSIDIENQNQNRFNQGETDVEIVE